jgi:DNA-binding NarL/FixJ family response regulator
MKCKIIIIEDDKEFAELQKSTINTLNNFEVVDYYLNPMAFLKSIHKHIDIILLDIIMPEMDGITAIKFISEKYPKSSIVINSIKHDTDTILKCLQEGAVGYVDKQNFFDYVEEVLNSVINEGAFITPKIAKRIFEYFAHKKNNLEELTPRESQVAQAISEGMSYKMVADKLNISIDTVRMNIRNIYRKLKINSKSELVKYILENRNFG